MKLEENKRGMSSLECFRMRKRNIKKIISELHKTMSREERELEKVNRWGDTAKMYRIQEHLQDAYNVYNNEEK